MCFSKEAPVFLQRDPTATPLRVDGQVLGTDRLPAQCSRFAYVGQSEME